MSGLNYRKWDHIEVSDDEDDTHPNIDTPSLFRWRHQARVEREAKFNEEKAKFERDYKSFLTKLEDAKTKLKESKEKNNEEDIAKYTKLTRDMEKEDKSWIEQKEKLAKEERLKPWNIDTICHEGKSKTVINKPKAPEPEAESEEARIERLQRFVKENEALIKKFGMFQRPDDTLNFLLEHTHLVCEDTANKLVLWCIDLAVEEKFDLMDHVSHQCIVMQFLLELAKSLKIDPRACIRPFFNKFRSPEPEYRAAFDDELRGFRERIRKRAKERIEEAMAAYEEEEKQKRLGPGGLDPVEVFESLPKELQECFEKKDMALLQEVVGKMDIKDAKYHIDRCIASGLWVPGPSDHDEEEETLNDQAENEKETSQEATQPENTNAYDLD
jgi:cell division cycle protein 37